MATRHKPTGEGLRSQILKRQHFLSKDASPAPEEEESSAVAKPDQKSKDAKSSLMADLQKLQKKVVKPTSQVDASRGDDNNNVESEENGGSSSPKAVNPFLAELGGAKSNKLKKTIKSKDPASSIQDQLQMRLAARKKLVDEAMDNEDN